MAQRTINTIKQKDYTSKKEFEKDIPKMKSKGYQLIENGMFNDAFNPQEIDDDYWKYTAHFMKSTM